MLGIESGPLIVLGRPSATEINPSQGYILEGKKITSHRGLQTVPKYFQLKYQQTSSGNFKKSFSCCSLWQVIPATAAGGRGSGGWDAAALRVSVTQLQHPAWHTVGT